MGLNEWQSIQPVEFISIIISYLSFNYMLIRSCSYLLALKIKQLPVKVSFSLYLSLTYFKGI